MTADNKVTVYAPIEVEQHITDQAKEMASSLAFPEEKQNDLQYIRSILVSAGTNKNGAHFLPSEMMKAHNTVVNKAIDIEHEEDKVIGHIYECAFLFKDGEQFDPNKVMAEYESYGTSADDLDIDVAVAGVVHKMRFPEISEEISGGDWKVSMECFFRDFDLKIGDTVISKQEAETLGYSPADLIGGFVKVIAGTKALGKHFVARVLRDITFSGMGIVKNPANPHSIILETAAHKELMEKHPSIIDLEQIDNLRGHKVEVGSDKKKTIEVEETTETPNNLTKVTAVSDQENVEEIYVEIDNETGGVKRVLTVGGSEDAALRYTGPGIGGPGNISSYPDEICKSFKKRLTKFNALDQSEGQVVREHWCALFEDACPVIGATAKAPECLRNQHNRTTKDAGDNTLTKTIREHVEDAPSNSFATVLQNVAEEERQGQVTRIREDAQNLRKSLREFVAAEKKTLK